MSRSGYEGCSPHLLIAVISAVLVFTLRWSVLRVLGVSAVPGLAWAAIGIASGIN